MSKSTITHYGNFAIEYNAKKHRILPPEIAKDYSKIDFYSGAWFNDTEPSFLYYEGNLYMGLFMDLWIYSSSYPEEMVSGIYKLTNIGEK